MFAPTRDQARAFLAGAWAKYRAGAPLSGLEQRVVAIVSMHPEYHALLEDGERHLARDFAPDDGTPNPFLHLSLHLAIDEQLAIDQPAGLKEEVERLTLARGDRHQALHAVLECLGEVLWQAQRDRAAPDGARYLDCLRRQR